MYRILLQDEKKRKRGKGRKKRKTSRCNVYIRRIKIKENVKFLSKVFSHKRLSMYGSLFVLSTISILSLLVFSSLIMTSYTSSSFSCLDGYTSLSTFPRGHRTLSSTRLLLPRKPICTNTHRDGFPDGTKAKNCSRSFSWASLLLAKRKSYFHVNREVPIGTQS